MSSVSKASKILGVARSTLLYYERIGIISPARNPENGYRDYSQKDIDKLLLFRQLQHAGFTLKESVAVMEGTLDPDLIKERCLALEQKIETMVVAREVLRSLLFRATGETLPGGEADNPGRQLACGVRTKGGRGSFRVA